MIKKASLIIFSLFLSYIIFCFCLWFYFDIPALKTPKKTIEILSNIGKINFHFNVYFCFAFASLPPFFTLIHIFFSKSAEAFGKARFAEKKDIKKMGLNFKEGFVLAKKWGKKIYYNNSLSLLCFAPPGSGKTQAVCIPICTSFKHSMVILDVKGEIYKTTSRYRSEVLKNKILVFSPYNKAKNTLFFNPFAKEIMASKTIGEIDRLLKTVARTLFKEEKDPHWIESAQSLFMLVAMYQIQKKGETSFYDLAKFLSQDLISLLDDNAYNKYQEQISEGINPNPLKFFLKMIAKDKSIDELIRIRANRFEASEYREFSGIRSTFQRVLEPFLSYEIKEATDKMNFNYEDLRNKNITIYIEVLEQDIQSLKTIIRVMYEVISLNLLSKESNKEEERIVFLLDEFPSFGKFDFIVELPRLARSYNIVTMFFAQSSSQIKETYNENILDILNEIVGYKVIFGMNTKKSADIVSESIGDFTRTKESQSRQDLNFFGSTNISEEGYKRITSQDLMNLSKNEIIIQVTKHYALPLIAEANYWFKDKKLSRTIEKFKIKE